MSRYREIYRVEQLPVLQNRMYHSESEARNCAKGDMVLAQDTETGLVSNIAFQAKGMQYDADYQNEQAVSSTFQEHLRNVSKIIARCFQGESLVEVGCGKGYFLELLQALGFDITGLDPIYDGDNPAIRKEYFDAGTGIRADGIILRHVLEHVPDPIGFLSKIRDANGGSGKVYIEVPCFDWVRDHRTWFDICYEHVNYFRLSDFFRMFGRVYEAGRLFNRQYLYAVADLATVETPTCDESYRLEMPEDFLVSVQRHATKLLSTNRRAVWGGATKGVIFSLFLERAGVPVDMVIDINPAKQGKYLAATGIRICSPEEAGRLLPPGSDVFVMNGNYLEEIRELTEGKFNYVEVNDEAI